MIEFKNVSKSYQREVVKDLSFSLEDGKSLAIFGPSGMGKSTILKLILGVEKPSSGNIYNSYAKPSIVFQENRLIEEISALDNLRMISDDTSLIRESLAKFAIYDFDNKLISKFSGGMKRRVPLARAYVHGGDYLVMDESFYGLDYNNKVIASDLLKDKFIGQTKIIVSHNKEDFKLMDIEDDIIINL